MNDASVVRGRVLERRDLLVRHEREWTLGELFVIFRRRRRIVLFCVLTLTFLAGLYCIFAIPRYVATGQIEVDKEPAGTLGLDRSMTADAPSAEPDALDTNLTMGTEAKILTSPTLALKVIKDLRLEHTADYFPEHATGGWIPKKAFFWRKPVEPLSTPLEEAPRRRYASLKIFASRLKVTPVSGTRLIDISYSSPDPQVAAAAVNRLITALQEYAFQSRFQATAEASAWLSQQLAGLKKQTEDLQHTADALEQGTGIYGQDTSHNLVLTRLEGLNSALAAAESNRILKQAVYEVARNGDPEMISGLAGNASAGATPAMTNSLALLQTLRAQQAQVQAEIDEDDARYGSAYPKIAELHGELDGLDKSIAAEIARIGERARTDYEIAQRAEDAARSAFEQQKQVASDTNSRMVAYELARQEADGSRDLYQGLLAKLKEAGVLEGLRSTNLSLVNAGMAPPADRPSSPNVPLCFAAALAGGLLLGCSGALIREATDTRVRSVEELEQSLGVSLAGMVPELGRMRLFRRGRSRGAFLEEEARGTRHSLAPLLPREGAPQAILIASAVPGDGKSRLAASLGASLARSGARVLLVDADLMCPSLHTLCGSEAAAPNGLSESLATGVPAEVHECAQVAGLWVVRAGSPATSWDGTALLASPRMDALLEQWRRQYDFVLLDSAPLLPVPDAATLARLCDRALLVVRYESTRMQAVQRSYRMLEKHLRPNAELDVVMNGVPKNSPDYFAYYGHKGWAYGRV